MLFRSKSPEHTALAGIEAMEDFYRAIGMPVSICELIGRQATDEEIKLMADKCSSGGSTTTGNLKVLHRDDMKISIAWQIDNGFFIVFLTNTCYL